jgi:hypothetical protein
MVSRMNRRHFIQAAASSLFVPSAVTLAHAPAPATFDERFAAARRLAAEMANSCVLTPVQGDITALWKSGLDRACRRSSLTMRGVTTESFYFCLKIMVGEHANLDTQVTRLDRDLFVWTMHTGR